MINFKENETIEDELEEYDYTNEEPLEEELDEYDADDEEREQCD